MTGAHSAAVLAIYQAGIAEGNSTFETCAPDWAAFTAARLPAHRFVAIAGGRVAGWVAASAVSGRCVYAGVVEHSVYVHPAARGRGTGRRLLDALIASTEAAGIWTIQSGIFPENAASLALHQAAGFRMVGTGNASASTAAAGATSCLSSAAAHCPADPPPARSPAAGRPGGPGARGRTPPRSAPGRRTRPRRLLPPRRESGPGPGAAGRFPRGRRQAPPPPARAADRPARRDSRRSGRVRAWCVHAALPFLGSHM